MKKKMFITTLMLLLMLLAVCIGWSCRADISADEKESSEIAGEMNPSEEGMEPLEEETEPPEEETEPPEAETELSREESKQSEEEPWSSEQGTEPSKKETEKTTTETARESVEPEEKSTTAADRSPAESGEKSTTAADRSPAKTEESSEKTDSAENSGGAQNAESDSEAVTHDAEEEKTEPDEACSTESESSPEIAESSSQEEGSLEETEGRTEGGNGLETEETDLTEIKTISVSLKEEIYFVDDVITIEDLIVTAVYFDGTAERLADGWELVDRTLGHTPAVVQELVLAEYEGSIYKKDSYKVSIIYQGVESERIDIPCRYREGVSLVPEMMELVNEAREAAGLSALHWNNDAESAALIRAQELAKVYSHQRPDGSMTSALYGDVWGENIAKGSYRSRDAAEQVFAVWMNSAGHRECILDETPYAVGVVCARCIATDENGHQMAYWIMLTTVK